MEKRMTQKPIDLAAFLTAQPEPYSGAVASFVGVVRNHDHGQAVEKLYYECYEALAEKQLQAIIDECREQWKVNRICIQHRVGQLQVGEAAVAIVVTANHRAEAFSACRDVIEKIKTQVPIWKHEFYEDGSDAWVLCSHRDHVEA